MDRIRRRRAALLSTGGLALLAFGVAACDQEVVFEPRGFQQGATAPAAVEDDTIADAVRDPDPFARARRLGSLLPTLGPEAVDQVEAVLSDPSISLDGMETELLLRSWSVHDPEAATAWAVAKAPIAFRMGAVIAALEPWAARDPQAARATAERLQHERPDVAEVVQLALVRGWFTANPKDLATYIQALGPGFLRLRALATYIRESIRTYGIEATRAWAESVPEDDEGYKLGVYRQMASILPHFDHDAGIAWCEAHCDGPFGMNLRSLVARRWAENDGEAAILWLAERPQGHERDVALRATYAVWKRRDPEAALAWGREQTSGEQEPWLQPILPVYTRHLAESSPSEAAELALRIEDEEQREAVLADVLQRWQKMDTPEAESWLQEAALPEELREKLRQAAPAAAPAAGPAATQG